MQGARPAKRCLGEGMEMQHSMALARSTASSRKGDSAAALTASEAKCIREWPGPICTSCNTKLWLYCCLLLVYDSTKLQAVACCNGLGCRMSLNTYAQ